MTASAAAPGAFHALTFFYSIVHTFIHPHLSRRPTRALVRRPKNETRRAETRRRHLSISRRVAAMPTTMPTPRATRATTPTMTRATTRCARRRRARVRASTTNDADVDVDARATSTMDDDARKLWNDARAVVRDAVGANGDETNDDDVDAMMEKAFGWRGQGYWRNTKVREVPTAADVTARVAFLESIGVTTRASECDLAKIVKKQPEILACDVEQLTAATEHIEKNYFMKRDTRNFVKYVVRVPQALGNNLDCAGEGKACLGECNRCWARC